MKENRVTGVSQKGQPGAKIGVFCKCFQTEPVTVNDELFLLLGKLGAGQGRGQAVPPKGDNMVGERRDIHRATASNHPRQCLASKSQCW